MCWDWAIYWDVEVIVHVCIYICIQRELKEKMEPLDYTRFTRAGLSTAHTLSASVRDDGVAEIEVSGYEMIDCGVLVEYATQARVYVSVAAAPLRLYVSTTAAAAETADVAFFNETPMQSVKQMTDLTAPIVTTPPLTVYKTAIGTVAGLLAHAAPTGLHVQPYKTTGRVVFSFKSYSGVGGRDAVGLYVIERILETPGVATVLIGETVDSQKMYIDVSASVVDF